MSDVGEAAASAALEEIEAREGGTSAEDCAAYGEVAGAAAGVAACSAVGAAAAASVCAWIGGEVGGWVTETVAGWFVDDEAAQRARERREAVHRYFQRQAACRELGDVVYADFAARIQDLRDLHRELWPEQTWESGSSQVPELERPTRPAIVLLASMGLELESREGPEGVTLGLPSLEGYWFELEELGVSSEAAVEDCEQRATEIADQLRSAYNRSVIELTAQAGGEWAELAVNRPAVIQIARHPAVIQVGGENQMAMAIADTPELPDVPARQVVCGAEELAHMKGRRSPWVPPERRSFGRAAARIGAALGLSFSTLGVLKWWPWRT